MPKKRRLHPNSIWDVPAVQNAFAEAGASHTHINKMYRHLMKHPLSTWHDVANLPKAAVAALDAGFVVHTTRLVDHQIAADGETIKLLIELQDDLQIEAVIMQYDTSRMVNVQREEQEQDEHGSDAVLDAATIKGGRRATLCVSSEVGCQMGCTFCATGTMGLTADLTSGEIVEQLVHALRIRPVRNVVFMGMGEPLNNYESVRSAVSLMTDPQVFQLRRRSVTVSTVGVIPRIASLAADLPGVSLALSLHAPNQALRQTIVPSAKAYKLDKLIAAMDAYQASTKQRVFIEYVVLGPDVNCTIEHAHQLGSLLRGKDVVVNLIPWNPILSPAMEFRAPPTGTTAEFQRILRQEYGLPSTVRQEKGQDVAAACGQLVLEKQSGRGNGCGASGKSASVLHDVEDLMMKQPLGCSRGSRTAVHV